MAELVKVNKQLNFSNLLEDITRQFEEVVQWRRHLHQNPELSFEEYETSQFIAEKLEEFGFDVKRNVGGTGLIARLEGKYSGKTIAFRADFDALPIQDLKTVSYASKKEGISHACGHDGHTSALLGFAKVLAGYRELLHGNVLFVFQHAEEKPPGGAKDMIAENILDDVDYVFGAHLDSSLPIGKVSVGARYQMAAVDYFKIDLKGRGGHGARPQNAIDALVAGAELVGALQKIVSRNVNPLESAVVTIGQFHSGTAFNVIAETAMLEGTVRTYDESIRQLVKERIEQITKGIALAHQIEFEIDYLHGYPALYNDEAQTEKVRQAFLKGFGSEAVVEQVPTMGAEDFAYFLLEKTGTYFRVGSRNEKKETQYAHHHGSFDIDENALTNIQKAFAYIVQDYLMKKE